MIDRDRIPPELLPIIEKKLKGYEDKILFPPPVFDTLKGEVISIDIESETITNRFPVLHEHLNPYGTMQGGIIAALVDNTIGPLSLIVATPNFTRTMEMTYSKPITPDMEYVYVTARFTGQERRSLYFEADVKTEQGQRLATAKSTHRII